jgi:hypothetical protein
MGGTVRRSSGGMGAQITRRLAGLHRRAAQPKRPSQPQKVRKAPRRMMVKRGGAMCLEQRIDYVAACDGKITWARYFAKWGPSL